MITFQIISTESETVQLKTRKHEKTYTVHQCKQSDRAAYVAELTQTFNNEGTLTKSTNQIKSFYFGFPNSAQADKFADFCKYKFPLLDKVSSHCEARLSKRLRTPFEVKIRNLAMISDDLLAFFGNCIEKDMQPKVIDLPQVDHDAMRAKVKRL